MLIPHAGPLEEHKKALEWPLVSAETYSTVLGKCLSVSKVWQQQPVGPDHVNGDGEGPGRPRASKMEKMEGDEVNGRNHHVNKAQRQVTALQADVL